MDWKREAADKLRCYEVRRQALESIPLEIERLELAYTGLRAACGGGVSGSGRDREDVMLSNIVRRQELEQRLKEARLWVVQVDKALAVLTEEERLVLGRFYIHRAPGCAGELCQRLCVEKSTLYRKRDSALRRFSIARYGATETA